jgi:quercetin dioxygenase-like cupin family protein
MPVRLALFQDVLTADAKLSLPIGTRGVFARRGSLQVVGAHGEQRLMEGACLLFEKEVRIHGPGEAWTFELSRSAGAAAMTESEYRRVVLAATIDRDPSQPLLVRADRVDFLAGAVTPKHGHQGPGIRCLIEGRLVAELGHEVRRINPGDAWFEAGPDPVVGRTLAPTSAFVRVMVLDPSLRDQPTFIPWTPEEADKPRGTVRQLFFDTIIMLA